LILTTCAGSFIGVRDGAITYLTLPEAAGICPGRPTDWTMRRWIKRGIRGVQLRAVYQGRWYTTAVWVQQFIEARAASRLGGRRHVAAVAEQTDRAYQLLRDEWGLDV
jgi:hypothetical protein